MDSAVFFDYFAGFLFVSLQATLAVASGYFLLRAMRGIRLIGRGDTKDAIWSAWFMQAMWTLLLFVFLTALVFLGAGRGMYVVAVFSLVLLALSAVQMFFALRRFGVVAEKGKEQQLALVKLLQPNRIRGLGEGGSSVVLSASDLEGFQELRGVVRMLNMRAAGCYAGAGILPCLPIMSFRGDDGSSEFVLYPDDVVVLG